MVIKKVKNVALELCRVASRDFTHKSAKDFIKIRCMSVVEYTVCVSVSNGLNSARSRCVVYQ